MPKIKIKKGDLVQVITGKDKGLQGKVIGIDREKLRVTVEGVNKMTKHVKPGATATGSRAGGIEVVEAPLHISNVMLVDPESGKPTRVGYRLETEERDGRTRTVRIRYAKRSGKDI